MTQYRPNPSSKSSNIIQIYKISVSGVGVVRPMLNAFKTCVNGRSNEGYNHPRIVQNKLKIGQFSSYVTVRCNSTIKIQLKSLSKHTGLFQNSTGALDFTIKTYWSCRFLVKMYCKPRVVNLNVPCEP